MLETINDSEEEEYYPDKSLTEAHEWLWEKVGISGIRGPEGAGKSSYLASYAITAKYGPAGNGWDDYPDGIDVFSFPNFEVYENQKDKVPFTKKMTLEEFIMLGEPAADKINAEKYPRPFVILIDQIESYLNSHRWGGIMPDACEHVADQRRKLGNGMGAGIVYTLQIWEELLPRIRNRTHYLFDLFDLHWAHTDASLPRGHASTVYWLDNLGFAHGIRGLWYPAPNIFHPISVRGRFDTFQKTSAFEKLTKIKVNGKVITIDLEELMAGNFNGAEQKEGGDGGVEIQEPTKAELRKIDTARKGIHALFDKNGEKAVASSKVYTAAHLKSNSRKDQQVFNLLAEEIGLEKSRSGYKREPLLVNK